MAVAYRSKTELNALGGGTSFTINVPAGVVNGDCLILFIATPSFPVWTTPTNWNAFASNSLNGGADVGGVAYWKVASSEPADYTVSAPAGGVSGCALMLAYSGTHASTPIDAQAGIGRTSAGTQDAPALTTTVANAMLVSAIGVDASASQSFTEPGTMTERADFVGDSSVVLAAADVIQAAAGAVPTKTWTLSASDAAVVWIVSLAPPAAPAGGARSQAVWVGI